MSLWSAMVVSIQAHGSGGSYPTASLPARIVVRVGRWSTPGPQIPSLGTISLGTGLSCLADHSICSSETICVDRECPLQTVSDRPIGHATGTSPWSAAALLLGLGQYCVDAA